MMKINSLDDKEQLREELNRLYNIQEKLEHIEDEKIQIKMVDKFLTKFATEETLQKEIVYKLADIWDDDNAVKRDPFPFLKYGAGITVYFVLQRNLIKLFAVLSLLATI